MSAVYTDANRTLDITEAVINITTAHSEVTTAHSDEQVHLHKTLWGKETLALTAKLK